MTSRLHEGMTRTQSPPRTGSPLRLTALIALCAAVLLILGWAVLSPLGGTGEQQAQAQTSGTGEGPSGTPGEEEEPSYEAFGEQKNPFARVVQAKTEDSGNGGQSGGENTGNNEGGTDGPVSRAQQPAGNEPEDQDRATLDDDNGDDARQRTAPPAPPPENGGTAAGSGAGDVNCQNPTDDFEELLCEESAPGSGGDRTTSAQPGGSGEIEDDRDGGSGRSGAGEPTDTFRNGGPAPGK